MELVDFNRFVWRKSDEVPGRYIREAGGGEVIEDIWKLTKHGEQNLFIGIYASLSVSLPSDEPYELIKSAWASLRWEVPTIAASTSHIWHQDKAPTTFIVYDSAKSHSDVVDVWVSETLACKPEYQDRTLDDLRYDIGHEPIPVNDFDRQTFLYLVPYSPTTFGLLLRTAHTTFDGAGVKTLMTKLMMHLEKYISDPGYATAQKAAMKWGTEGERLLPIVTEILRKYEPKVVDEQGVVISEERQPEIREGKEYFDCLLDVMNTLVTGLPRAHRFKSFIDPPFDPSTSMPKTRRIEHRFTVEESVKIHAAGAVGGIITEKLTVNHIVHGALCLIPLFDNPPPPNSDGLVFYYGLVDGRQRLAKEYRGPLDYPGYCLGMSGLHIPVSIFQQHRIEDKKTLVIEYAKAVRKEYLKQAAYPSLVAIEPQEGDLMLSAPAPPPWAGPAYAADGKGAVYLRPRYPQTSDSERPAVIEITDFFMGLNKCDPGPFFRCTEWRGQIILSVDFNEFAVDKKVVKGWMDLWAELILSITV